MIEFLKYIRGYVRIRVSGFSPERFMNLCGNKGILLWKIVKEGDVYYMNINLKGFRALRPIARKTGTRVAIVERYGLPFFLPKLLKRKVFVGGLLLVIAFWMWSSLFVWDIGLSGNYQITDDMLQSFLEEHAVTVGMKKGALDIGSLEKELRRTFPEITWVSAKLSGTRLMIDIKENDTPVIVKKEPADVGSDLVTDYAGTVVSIIVRSGVPIVSAGDTVEAGTVLVEGKVPIYNDDGTVREYIYVEADADIILEHVRDFTAELPCDYVIKEYTGREKTQHYLRVGSSQWKLPEDRPYLVYDSVIRESRPLLFEKLSIPVYKGTYTYREYMDVEYRYSRSEAEERLDEKLMLFIESLAEKGVQIIEKDVKIELTGNSWVLSGQFLVREPVGDSAAIEKIVIGETVN